MVVPISFFKKKAPKGLLTIVGTARIRGIRSMHGHSDYVYLCFQCSLMNRQEVDTEAGNKGLGEPHVV